MPDLMVVITEDVPPSLRGRLALWLVEVRSGVYVGMYSVKVREYIWDNIEKGLKKGRGNVLMVWKDVNDAGYSVKTSGTSAWKPVDFDGVTLMSYLGNNNDIHE